MPVFLRTLLAVLRSILRSRAAVELENLALRHQIGVLQMRLLRNNVCTCCVSQNHELLQTVPAFLTSAQCSDRSVLFSDSLTPGTSTFSGAHFLATASG